MNYYLNIGSNMGDRRDNLNRAVVALVAGTSGCALSTVVESEPWGFQSEHRFMNIGMWVVSDMCPDVMLDHIHDIEHRLGSASHRDAKGGYIDRLVDIDIVAIDDLVIDTPTLQVPHPHLSEREFFLKPMIQLAPAWRHPLTGLTASQMLEELNRSPK
ncbi:MAG: 2-amino-4-hydroxy-6-hydroxymethyldihydropteridine diphosphokinase [Muribaculaceae bacterium]|nr:2-amino-4-hydroxy-6-hydroxymethyldihydropteridine diphosphokinase [Muribaculaceae bacterium]